MGYGKETLTIKQVHDNEKWILKREQTDELDKETLVKQYLGLKSEVENLRKAIADSPTYKKNREEYLQKQLDNAKKALEDFPAEFEKGSKQMQEMLEENEKRLNDMAVHAEKYLPKEPPEKQDMPQQ